MGTHCSGVSATSRPDRESPLSTAFETKDFFTRKMHTSDIDSVMRVEAACYENPWPRGVFLKELKNEWSRVEVVLPYGESQYTVGHMVYWIVHDELHILNVAVHPDVQRQGIGRSLLRQLMDVCATERLQYITLEVRSSNEAAKGLYGHFGFKQIGLRRRYYQDNGEDAVVMALVIEDKPTKD